MGWKEVLVARIEVVTQGVLWFEAAEPDLALWWCKGWGYMGMLTGGSAMLIAIDASSYVRGKCIPVSRMIVERTSLSINNVSNDVVRRDCRKYDA